MYYRPDDLLEDVTAEVVDGKVLLHTKNYFGAKPHLPFTAQVHVLRRTETNLEVQGDIADLVRRTEQIVREEHPALKTALRLDDYGDLFVNVELGYPVITFWDRAGAKVAGLGVAEGTDVILGGHIRTYIRDGIAGVRLTAWELQNC